MWAGRAACQHQGELVQGAVLQLQLVAPESKGTVGRHGCSPAPRPCPATAPPPPATRRPQDVPRVVGGCRGRRRALAPPRHRDLLVRPALGALFSAGAEHRGQAGRGAREGPGLVPPGRLCRRVGSRQGTGAAWHRRCVPSSKMGGTGQSSPMSPTRQEPESRVASSSATVTPACGSSSLYSRDRNSLGGAGVWKEKSLVAPGPPGHTRERASYTGLQAQRHPHVAADGMCPRPGQLPARPQARPTQAPPRRRPRPVLTGRPRAQRRAGWPPPPAGSCPPPRRHAGSSVCAAHRPAPGAL